MKNHYRWLAWIVVMLLIASCSGRGATPTPDMQATVDVSVAATKAAETAVQATIQAGVSGTVAAIPTWTPQPTATPSPEMLSKSEEELAADAESAVSQVNRSIEDTSSATTEAVSDGTLTQEEIDELYSYMVYAYSYVDEAEAILAAYEDVYGDLAAESLEEIYALESELESLTNSLNAINASLEEINTTLQQGQVLAAETIQQLETAAQNASAQAQQAQTAFETYQNELAGKIETRQQTILETKPTNIPMDLKSTLLAGFDYLDTVTQALADQKISRDELGKIAELGANFGAGANQFGGPALKDLSNQMNGPQGITANLAGGRNSQARSGLAGLESGLSSQPGGRPGRP